MNTENQGVKKIDLNALKKVNNYLGNLNPEEKQERLKMNVCFYDHLDLMYTLQSFFKIIGTLSENKELFGGNEINVANLCSVAEQLIPMESAEFLDTLFIKEKHLHNTDFKAINKL